MSGMNTLRLVRLPRGAPLSDGELIQNMNEFNQRMQMRRTVRDFSPRPVPREVIESCLCVAGSAPSGANLQPWHFVAVADAEVKRKVRLAAEAEEREFYEHRAPAAWLEALAPLGTDWRKPFLETAPWLIAVFVQSHSFRANGTRVKHYYATESVGIATGFLVAALHYAGLVSLTHTPSPMAFLNRILKRPAQEKPFLLLVVGHPAEGAQVPDIHRKPLSEIASFVPTRE